MAEGLFTWPADEPRLIGARCTDCGLVGFPAGPACQRCGGTEVTQTLLKDRGTLWTFTTQDFRPPSPPYDGTEGAGTIQPYALGYVELPGEVMVAARAERTAAGWRLSGKKSFVIDGAIADLVLVVARSTAGPGLFAVDRGAAGLRAEPMTALDPTRAMAALTFDRVPAVLVGTEGHAGWLMSRVLDLACVALAAEQAGGARRCLEMSAGYARTRFQFGRPIGSFQAVKHKCADMLVRVELAEATAREAARLADEATAEFGVAAATAHICCSQAYLFAATENIQVHGSIGFTWEHPAHLYFRRAKSCELLFGGPAVYHERLLDRLGI